MDNLTPNQRKKNMQAIKCKGSKIEKILARALWHTGLRYRKNNVKIYGRPDFIFLSRKIAIFCDGEFWHGKDWNTKKKPATNATYWKAKIDRNIARDTEVNQYLERNGWLVIRLWETDIIKNTNYCVNRIYQAYISRSEIRKKDLSINRE